MFHPLKNKWPASVGGKVARWLEADSCAYRLVWQVSCCGEQACPALGCAAAPKNRRRVLSIVSRCLPGGCYAAQRRTSLLATGESGGLQKLCRYLWLSQASQLPHKSKQLNEAPVSHAGRALCATPAQCPPRARATDAAPRCTPAQDSWGPKARRKRRPHHGRTFARNLRPRCRRSR